VKLLRLASAALLVALVGLWLAMRRGGIPMVPSLFAAGVGVFMLFAVAWLVSTVAGAFKGRIRPITATAEILVGAGLLAVSGGGMTNWALGLQGNVVLLEGDRTPLSKTSQLLAFDAGPLARMREMRGILELVELGLVPEGGGFLPESRLRFVRGHGEVPRELKLGPGAPAVDGSLRFYQGAFGFAPRIVVVKDGRTVLDEKIPFRTQQTAPGLLRFEGEFEVASEGLQIQGAISLEGLNENMKGHPKLGLIVRKGGRNLGGGELMPGHFAEIAEGYRVGFAGMTRWSEIDISRRNYPLPILVGAGVALLGLCLWPLAAWRGW
jgi:hypothetical protein